MRSVSRYVHIDFDGICLTLAHTLMGPRIKTRNKDVLRSMIQKSHTQTFKVGLEILKKEKTLSEVSAQARRCVPWLIRKLISNGTIRNSSKYRMSLRAIGAAIPPIASRIKLMA